MIPKKFQRAARAKKLTPRQIEICYLIGIGKAWKEIADDLAISPWTVKFHARCVAQKLGVWNCVSAFARILNFG
jgi:DNA-binding NarL/FixJ family response regulator